MSTMLAAIQAGPGRMEVRRFPSPVPGADQLLVRVTRAALCGSDLHIVYDDLGKREEVRPAPGTPGHEAVGVVELSNSPDFQVGDRVLLLGFSSYAEYTVVDAARAVPVPAGVEDRHAVLGQQLGVVLYGLRNFGPTDPPPATAAILGFGPIGYLFASVLKARGTGRVVASDLNPARLALAPAGLLERGVVSPGESVVAAVMEATGGAGADLVVEAAGFDTCRADAVRCARVQGRIGFFGYPETYDDSPFPFGEAFARSPITMTIVRNAQDDPGLACFREALAMIADGALDLAPLLGPEFPLPDVQAAFACAREQRAMKVHVTV